MNFIIITVTTINTTFQKIQGRESAHVGRIFLHLYFQQTIWDLVASGAVVLKLF